MKPSTSIRVAWLAALACIGCCAIIPVLVLAGLTGLAGLACYFDIAAIGFLVLSVALFVYAMYKKNRSARGVDCSGGTKSN